MALTRIGKVIVLLALGVLLVGGAVLGGLAAPAQASTSTEVVLGAHRTSPSPATSHRSDRSSRTDPSVRAHRQAPDGQAPGPEEGTTEYDLTAAGHSDWWWGGWLLLAVPVGSVLAWWMARPRGTVPPGVGPLYS